MVLSSESIIPTFLIDEFKTCARLQYNGKLEIQSCKGYKFSFYYRLGRIVWATGGAHPFRRWRRHMVQYCPQINLDTMHLYFKDTAVEHWGYQILETLCKEQKINRQQVVSIVDSTIAEVLFDLAQQVNCTSITSKRNQEVILEAPISLSRIDVSLQQMYESWYSWSESGLASFSPDLAPVLRHPEQLQELVKPTVYTNFVKLMKGKYTLRDLATNMKQDVLGISRSLLPYILRGMIELVEVEDSPLFIQEQKNEQQRVLSQSLTKSSKAPLIACIDDSPQICMSMEKIILANGMRFVGIQDPLQILTTLIEHRPDFIFLDLIMPVTNGYEVCSQIRRVSNFTKTPVVILTGSDGIFDKMRAKLAGSTDFINKPAAQEKILAVIQKHLRTNTNVQVDDLPMAPFLGMSYVS